MKNKNGGREYLSKEEDKFCRAVKMHDIIKFSIQKEIANIKTKFNINDSVLKSKNHRKIKIERGKREQLE